VVLKILLPMRWPVRSAGICAPGGFTPPEREFGEKDVG